MSGSDYQNRIQASLSERTAAVPAPGAAVGASKDKRELLLVADEILRCERPAPN